MNKLWSEQKTVGTGKSQKTVTVIQRELSDSEKLEQLMVQMEQSKK